MLCSVTGSELMRKRLFPAIDLWKPSLVDWFDSFHLLSNRCREINDVIPGRVCPKYWKNRRKSTCQCAGPRWWGECAQECLLPRTVLFHVSQRACYCSWYVITFQMVCWILHQVYCLQNQIKSCALGRLNFSLEWAITLNDTPCPH